MKGVLPVAALTEGQLPTPRRRRFPWRGGSDGQKWADSRVGRSAAATASRSAVLSVPAFLALATCSGRGA